MFKLSSHFRLYTLGSLVGTDVARTFPVVSGMILVIFLSSRLFPPVNPIRMTMARLASCFCWYSGMQL
jgi:hypothetical protein